MYFNFLEFLKSLIQTHGKGFKKHVIEKKKFNQILEKLGYFYYIFLVH